jgi:hypothetical protein
MNSFTGPLPTELGTMDALYRLCVCRPSNLQTVLAAIQ